MILGKKVIVNGLTRLSRMDSCRFHLLELLSFDKVKNWLTLVLQANKEAT